MTIIYCNNCKQCGESKLKGSTGITVILILFLIILGICKFCGSSNVIPANQKPVQQIQQTANQPIFENVKQINCPDCRELIRFDARKCKHCGSFVENQNN